MYYGDACSIDSYVIKIDFCSTGTYVCMYTIGLVTQANEYHSRWLSPGPIDARLFCRHERGTCQERWWPRFKEIDFRDTGLREVSRHTTILIRAVVLRGINTTLLIVNRQIWKKSSTRCTGIGKEADSVT